MEDELKKYLSFHPFATLREIGGALGCSHEQARFYLLEKGFVYRRFWSRTDLPEGNAGDRDSPLR